MAAPRAAVTDALRAIWERRKADVMGNVELVEQAVTALLVNGTAGEHHQPAVRAAHKLAGSAGMFGFAEASRTAREIELTLATSSDPDAAAVRQLAELVVRLRDELESEQQEDGSSSVTTSASSADRDSVILLLAGADELREALAGFGAPAGLRAVSAASLADAQALPGLDPVAVVLDLRAAPTAAQGLTLVEDIKMIYPAVPTMVLTETADFSDRVLAARSGVAAVLDAGRPQRHLLEVVLDVVERRRNVGLTVLAVDDDPAVLDVLSATMQAAGIRLRTLDDPRDLFQVVEEDTPDLLLLDFDLPGASGAELCLALRSDPRWESLPVVFLSSHAGPEVARLVFEAGGDDFLTKPFVAEELLARITNRFERTRLLRRHADTDPLTGLANRRRSVQQIDQYLRTAGRFGEPACLVSLDLDEFKQVNDRHGHAAGDQVLRSLAGMLSREFRSEDVVARWGGEEFVVAMYGVSKDQCVERIDHLLRSFRAHAFSGPAGDFHVTFSAGAAQYPDDGTTTSSLYESADQALYLAKASGRNRVCAAGEEADESFRKSAVDVVVVEDDELLADLVLHALETRGWSTRWIRDGEEAAEALTGPLTARAVLLDWDLPGLNGVSVLRRMAATDVLRQTRVIMLTGRSSESEVLETLQLGASDHVAKPFSVQVLMERTRKVLGG